MFVNGLIFKGVCPSCQVSRRYVSRNVGLIGVPFTKGQSHDGVGKGPNVIRNAGLIKELIAIGNNVKDFGDIACFPQPPRFDVPDKIKWLPDLAFCTRQLSDNVKKMLEEGRTALTLGGDHSIALGTVDGHIRAKKKVCVLWVDAHADVNTIDTSDTGNMHGMPVALLVKELTDNWPYLPGLDWQKPTLSLKNFAYIGLRSVDGYERLIIEKYGVPAFGMEDIERYGIDDVTKIALEKINPDGDCSLHVSFDIDSLDKLEAPSTGTPVRGGLTLREALHIMEICQRSGWLSAVDLVEVNPDIGSDLQVNTTIEAAISVLKAAFGFSRSGSIPKNIDSLPKIYPPVRPPSGPHLPTELDPPPPPSPPPHRPDVDKP